MRPTFFGCFPTQNPPEYPLVISLPMSPPINGDNPVVNTDTFRLDYTQKHTQIFLDQVHASVIGGFIPNTNSPDPNFGKCLQCAAIDRARYKVKPLLARSSFCTQCFQRYCFDPNNLTSASELPGRKLTFVDPDPEGVAAVSGFLSRSKLGLIFGFITALLVVAALSVFFIWRKRRANEAEYHKLKLLHDDPEPPVFNYDAGDSPRKMSYDSESRPPEISTSIPENPEEHSQ